MGALNIVTIVCIGLMIGTEFCVSVFINPILRRLDEAAQAHAVQMFAKRLGTAMPFWYAASLLLIIAEAVVRRHQPEAMFLIIAGAIWVAVIILTLLVLVPINNKMIQLQSSFPPEAQRQHQKWDMLHRMRVAALGAAMVCCLIGIGV